MRRKFRKPREISTAWLKTPSSESFSANLAGLWRSEHCHSSERGSALKASYSCYGRYPCGREEDATAAAMAGDPRRRENITAWLFLVNLDPCTPALYSGTLKAKRCRTTYDSAEGGLHCQCTANFMFKRLTHNLPPYSTKLKQTEIK